MEEWMAETIHLSKAAREIVRRRANGESVEVTSHNLETYRELARAGVMEAFSVFMRGPEAVFRFTEFGWNHREDLQRSRFTPWAMLRRIRRAFSPMGKSVSGAR
jgi:hypothetical protein